MPIINAGGIYIESVVSLPDAPVGQAIPFVFKGRNLGLDAVKVHPTAGCGCTKLTELQEVAAGADFEIAGYLEASKSALTYSKTVTLHIGDLGNGNFKHHLTLTFTGKTV